MLIQRPTGEDVHVQRVALAGSKAPMSDGGRHGGIVGAELERRGAHWDFRLGFEGLTKRQIGRYTTGYQDFLRLMVLCGLERLHDEHVDYCSLKGSRNICDR
jgi:hypothetical protein